MEKNGDLKFFMFFIVVLVFIFGGFILMRKSSLDLSNNNETVNNTTQEAKDIRLDQTKDYIYFSDVEEVAHELDLEYKNLNLNFNDSNGIAKMLNDETQTLKATLTYDETLKDAPHNNLKSVKYKLYNTYAYGNYISLIVDYYEYHHETLISYLSTKTYVFDKTNGKLLSEEELLNHFNITKEDALNKVKVRIEDEDVAKTGEDLDVDATLNSLANMPLYVDKIGRLTISVLVKSDQKDYNEVIILN